VKGRRGLHETRNGNETAVANAEVYPKLSLPAMPISVERCRHYVTKGQNTQGAF